MAEPAHGNSRLERIEDRLARLEDSLDKLTDTIAAVGAQAQNTAGRVTVVLSLLVAIFALATGGFATIQHFQDRATTAERRAETCTYIDADQNRELDRIIEDERHLYGDLGGVIRLSPRKQHLTHEINRERFDAVRATRPSYCPPAAGRSRYPTLEELGGHGTG